MKKYLSSAILILALAACSSGGGPSVSGGASEEAGSQSGSNSAWERFKNMVFSSEKTIEMPALGIMADTFITEAAKRRYDANQYAHFMLDSENGKRFSMLENINKSIEPTKRNFAQEKANNTLDTPFDAEHALYSIPIVLALSPRKGWEVEAIDDRNVSPEFDTPFFRKHRPKSTYNEELHVLYMDMLAASAMYTNDVFALIATELDGVTLNDPDAAQKRVIEIYNNIPADKLKALLTAASERVRQGKYSTDLTGSGNIHFTNSVGGDFVADARGVTWTKSGGLWFGDGRINGKQVSFKLTSTASLNQKQSETGSAATDAKSKVDGSSTVGVGK